MVEKIGLSPTPVLPPEQLLAATLKREFRLFKKELWRETRRKLRQGRKNRFTT